MVKEGSNDGRENRQFSSIIPAFFHGMGETSAEADPRLMLIHRPGEELTVFRFPDGFEIGPDHFYPIPVQYSPFRQLHRGIQTGLAAQSGQQSIGTLLFDDFFADFRE